MKSSTLAAPFVRDMIEGAAHRGHNVDKILRECGIAPGIVRRLGSRITFTQFSRLSRALAVLLEDEAYGLGDRPQKPNTYRLICHSSICTETAAEALRNYVDFLNVLDNCYFFEFKGGSAEPVLQISRRPGRRVRNNFALEHILLTLFRTLCWMADTQIPIVHVGLDYPKPPHGDEYRHIFYGSPVYFGQSVSSVCFHQSSLDLPIVRSREDLKNFLNGTSLLLLSQSYRSRSLATRLRLWISRQLVQTHTAPDMDAAAARFKLHSQTLRRQLHREGTSYQDIKAEVRRDIAINLVSHQKDSIESIGNQLGFSESRAFIRAFKQWTGLTPLAYRRLTRVR